MIGKKLCNCWYDIVPGQKHDKLLDYLDWIFIVYFVIFKSKLLAYMCINHDGVEAN